MDQKKFPSDSQKKDTTSGSVISLNSSEDGMSATVSP